MKIKRYVTYQEEQERKEEGDSTNFTCLESIPLWGFYHSKPPPLGELFTLHKRINKAETTKRKKQPKNYYHMRKYFHF